MTNQSQNACFDARSVRVSRSRSNTTNTLIGRKLETIYEVPTDCSEAVEMLLREIDRKLGL